MRPHHLAATALACLSWACTSQQPIATPGGEGGNTVSPEDLEPQHEGAAPFALVEIFTSEG